MKFFNSGLIIYDFKVEGKVPVVMERFNIERIVGDIALEIFFSTVVGTGSRSQYESPFSYPVLRFTILIIFKKLGF